MSKFKIILRFRLPYILFGIMATVFGILAGIHGSTRLGYPVPKFAGYVSAIMGIAWVAYGCRRITQNDIEKKILSICPQCEEPYHLGKIPDKSCPHCNVPLVPLKRFYGKSDQTDS
jgi:hypothetical protein